MKNAATLYHTRPCLALALAIVQGLRCDTATKFAGVGICAKRPRPVKRKKAGNSPVSNPDEPSKL